MIYFKLEQYLSEENEINSSRSEDDMDQEINLNLNYLIIIIYYMIFVIRIF